MIITRPAIAFLCLHANCFPFETIPANIFVTIGAEPFAIKEGKTREDPSEFPLERLEKYSQKLLEAFFHPESKDNTIQDVQRHIDQGSGRYLNILLVFSTRNFFILGEYIRRYIPRMLFTLYTHIKDQEEEQRSQSLTQIRHQLQHVMSIDRDLVCRLTILLDNYNLTDIEDYNYSSFLNNIQNVSQEFYLSPSLDRLLKNTITESITPILSSAQASPQGPVNTDIATTVHPEDLGSEEGGLGQRSSPKKKPRRGLLPELGPAASRRGESESQPLLGGGGATALPAAWRKCWGSLDIIFTKIRENLVKTIVAGLLSPTALVIYKKFIAAKASQFYQEVQKQGGHPKPIDYYVAEARQRFDSVEPAFFLLVFFGVIAILKLWEVLLSSFAFGRKVLRPFDAVNPFIPPPLTQPSRPVFSGARDPSNIPETRISMGGARVPDPQADRERASHSPSDLPIFDESNAGLLTEIEALFPAILHLLSEAQLRDLVASLSQVDIEAINFFKGASGYDQARGTAISTEEIRQALILTCLSICDPQEMGRSRPISVLHPLRDLWQQFAAAPSHGDHGSVSSVYSLRSFSLSEEEEESSGESDVDDRGDRLDYRGSAVRGGSVSSLSPSNTNSSASSVHSGRGPGFSFLEELPEAGQRVSSVSSYDSDHSQPVGRVARGDLSSRPNVLAHSHSEASGSPPRLSSRQSSARHSPPTLNRLGSWECSAMSIRTLAITPLEIFRYCESAIEALDNYRVQNDWADEIAELLTTCTNDPRTKLVQLNERGSLKNEHLLCVFLTGSINDLLLKLHNLSHTEQAVAGILNILGKNLPTFRFFQHSKLGLETIESCITSLSYDINLNKLLVEDAQQGTAVGLCLHYLIKDCAANIFYSQDFTIEAVADRLQTAIYWLLQYEQGLPNHEVSSLRYRKILMSLNRIKLNYMPMLLLPNPQFLIGNKTEQVAELRKKILKAKEQYFSIVIRDELVTLEQDCEDVVDERNAFKWVKTTNQIIRKLKSVSDSTGGLLTSFLREIVSEWMLAFPSALAFSKEFTQVQEQTSEILARKINQKVLSRLMKRKEFSESMVPTVELISKLCAEQVVATSHDFNEGNAEKAITSLFFEAIKWLYINSYDEMRTEYYKLILAELGFDATPLRRQTLPQLLPMGLLQPSVKVVSTFENFRLPSFFMPPRICQVRTMVFSGVAGSAENPIQQLKGKVYIPRFSAERALSAGLDTDLLTRRIEDAIDQAEGLSEEETIALKDQFTGFYKKAIPISSRKSPEKSTKIIARTEKYLKVWWAFTQLLQLPEFVDYSAEAMSSISTITPVYEALRKDLLKVWGKFMHDADAYWRDISATILQNKTILLEKEIIERQFLSKKSLITTELAALLSVYYQYQRVVEFSKQEEINEQAIKNTLQGMIDIWNVMGETSDKADNAVLQVLTGMLRPDNGLTSELRRSLVAKKDKSSSAIVSESQERVIEGQPLSQALINMRELLQNSDSYRLQFRSELEKIDRSFQSVADRNDTLIYLHHEWAAFTMRKIIQSARKNEFATYEEEVTKEVEAKRNDARLEINQETAADIAKQFNLDYLQALRQIESQLSREKEYAESTPLTTGPNQNIKDLEAKLAEIKKIKSDFESEKRKMNRITFLEGIDIDAQQQILMEIGKILNHMKENLQRLQELSGQEVARQFKDAGGSVSSSVMQALQKAPRLQETSYWKVCQELWEIWYAQFYYDERYVIYREGIDGLLTQDELGEYYAIEALAQQCFAAVGGDSYVEKLMELWIYALKVETKFLTDQYDYKTIYATLVTDLFRQIKDQELKILERLTKNLAYERFINALQGRQYISCQFREFQARHRQQSGVELS